MADQGIKVGDNVGTDTDLQAKFTTKFSSLKLYKWIDAEFTTDGSGFGSVTVDHDLGYIPVFQVWGKHTAQFSFLAATTYPNAFSLLGPLNSYRPYSGGIGASASNTQIFIQALHIEGFGGVSPNTTYKFRVLIWVDLSEDFSDPSNIALTGDYGFKVSKPGEDVLTAEEYKMAYSSKYKAVQYYENHIQSSSLTLPAMWASRIDQSEQAAVYVDFEHNLGYQPMFFVYSDLGGSNIYEVPYMEVFGGGIYTMTGLQEVSAWCDSERVRVLFNRTSWYISGNYGKVYAEDTYNIYVMIFTENLAGEASG